MCTYFIGVGKIGRKREFRLHRDPSVDLEVVYTKNGSDSNWRHIRLSNNDGTSVVVWNLPMDVAEYFYQWLVYWAGRG